MKKIGFGVFLMLLSCQENEIAVDAERYCSCIRKEQPEEHCLGILQELDDKYAFDPQGAAELKEEIRICLPAQEN